MSGALWDQVHGEPDNAYRAFELYRDMPSPRVSPERLGPVVGVTPAEAIGWLRDWHWLRRAASFDAALEQARQEHLAHFVSETNESVEAKHRQILVAAREVASNEILKILAQSKRMTYPIMKPRELSQMIKSVLELERLIRGQSTLGDGTEEVDHTDTMTDEELLEFDRLSHKAAGKATT